MLSRAATTASHKAPPLTARAFPPSSFLAEELASRGWTAERFGKLTGLGAPRIRRILRGAGRRPLTASEAEAIGRALGTGAQFWLALDASWRRWRQEHPK